MKDSTGIPVNVHVFAVSYVSQGGLPAFKVGVLEVSDSDSMLLPNLGRLAETRQLRRRGHRPKQNAGDSSGSSNGSSSGGDLGALDLEQSLGSDAPGSTFYNDFEGDAPAFWFDALSAGYEILCFSDSFQHCFGTCEGSVFFVARRLCGRGSGPRVDGRVVRRQSGRRRGWRSGRAQGREVSGLGQDEPTRPVCGVGPGGVCRAPGPDRG
ncbi:unnamed protein product [Prorocentrum cordatum]|uniref:Uncharacterized protein n=1 Tax=Prorocentrum cordatum TaxID=2364126 RepID=A0ABN9R6Q7_9DINO|nr:unnamed protein product [Polarella glacialis]